MNMTILKIVPGHTPEIISVPHTLEEMQSIVGGSIEAIYPFSDPVAIVCNEEGKLMGLEPNRALYHPETTELIDIICGTFFLCGLTEEDFGSLDEKYLNHYYRVFECPEVFLWNGNNIVVLKSLSKK